MLTDKDKTYEAVLLLGTVTDTQDTGGKVLESRDTSDVRQEDVEAALKSFVGKYAQVPPMYSALKVNGRKLYELAREGKEIERKARIVQIYGIRILKMELPRVWIKVRCSKGTYIRTLCHDVGRRLNCGGCMESLVRTRSGRFCLEESLSLDEIQRKKEEGTLMEAVIPVDAMFDHYPKMMVEAKKANLAKNGNPLQEKFLCPYGEDFAAPHDLIRLYDETGQFIAIYQWQEEKKTYHVVKMFYEGL